MQSESQYASKYGKNVVRTNFLYGVYNTNGFCVKDSSVPAWAEINDNR